MMGLGLWFSCPFRDFGLAHGLSHSPYTGVHSPLLSAGFPTSSKWLLPTSAMAIAAAPYRAGNCSRSLELR
eukprot:6472476-Amphidinium_carterae.1